MYVDALKWKETNHQKGTAYFEKLPMAQCLKKIQRLDFSAPVTFFAGENGTGKSTLLEAIAVAYGFNPEGGTKNFCFATKETHSSMHECLTLVKGAKMAKDNFFLRAESFYNVATQVDELDKQGGRPLTASYGGKSLHDQSHGESFMALVSNRFGGKGFYVLDEPEAALSPMRQMSLLAEIDRLVKDGSQFMIATHSPIVLSYPKAQIFVLCEEGITPTPYEKTEHYTVTKYFLSNHERMLQLLLGEESAK